MSPKAKTTPPRLHRAGSVSTRLLLLVLAGMLVVLPPVLYFVPKRLYALRSDPELVDPLVYCLAEDPGLRQTGGFTEEEPTRGLEQAKNTGKAARVSQLLKAGIDVNFVVTKEGDGKGAFPLIVAAQNGQVELVRLLLAAEGVSVNQTRTKDGVFPLYMACQNNHVEVVRLLLAAEGVSVNQALTMGATALFTACQNNHIEVVRLLLAAEGVSVNQACTDDCSFPLYIASHYNHIEVVRLLLAAHAQVNQVTDKGWSACHNAAGTGHAQLLEMLLEAGADVELKSDDDRTALDLAIHFKHPAAEAVIRKHLKAKLETVAYVEEEST